MANGHLIDRLGMRTALVRAFLFSIVLHLALYGAYHQGMRLKWEGYEKYLSMLMPKQSKYTPALMELLKFLPEPILEAMKTSKVSRQPPPMPALVFVAVDPMQATAETPAAPKFYSDKNSVAANPAIKKESDRPNIDGEQKAIPFTMSVPRQRQKLEPVQNPQPRPPDIKAAEERPPEPLVAETKPKPNPPPEAKPKPPEPVGDLAKARPMEIKLPEAKPSPPGKSTANSTGEGKATAEEAAPQTRPRTLAEARARMQDNAIAGQKMRQDGGVNRRLELSALDARATPFGAYDAAIVAAIQQRWYDLLDRYKFSSDVRGRVVLEFRLHSNGLITNMNKTDSTVGEVLGSICQLAVTDPAPYPKWPPEMRRMFGSDYRQVRFTFFYN